MSDIYLVEAKQFLLDAITTTADWRMQKASEYPEDKRNHMCAEALRKVVDILALYPEEYFLFEKLAEINKSGEDGWPEIENQFLSRWGFFNERHPNDLTYHFVEELDKMADEFLTNYVRKEKGSR